MKCKIIYFFNYFFFIFFFRFIPTKPIVLNNQTGGAVDKTGCC